MKPLFERVTIVGVGLIGGSLGLALRGRGLARHVVGVGHAHPSLNRAVERGAIDESTLDVARGVAEADLVVLATPVGHIVPLAEAACERLKDGAVVIDVGSTKAGVVAALEPMVRATGAHFVGCHPLAGSEKRSIDAAREDLFEGSVAVLTPTEHTHEQASDRVADLWRAVGARVIHIAPDEHDSLLALTSHLPHVAAAAVVLAVAEGGGFAGEDQDLASRLADFVAGGFRDTTRVASGDPPLWRDILLENRESVSTAIASLIQRLTALRDAVDRHDEDAIVAFLTQAKEFRDALTDGDLAGR